MNPSPINILRRFANQVASSIRGLGTSVDIEAGLGSSSGATNDVRRPPDWADEEDTEEPRQGIIGTPREEHEDEIYADSTIHDLRVAVESSEVPQSIDHFEVRRVLGQGGFGSVFLAYDTRLDRMVALKLLDRIERSAARRMLAYETRAASQLRHPNLVTVFQSGETRQGCYIVFEYVPGPDPENARTLRELLNAENRIAPDLAVEFIRQTVEGLAYAHDQGVVHRDIKPENILIDFKGMAYLADFGCARQRKRYSENLKSLVGTLPYMSLEQINGQWNAQTDIWSVGVVLYEILSGQRPFQFAENAYSRSASEAAFSFAVAMLETEIESIEGVDADLMAICRKCLNPKLEKRYQTASALLQDLTRWQRNEPVSCRSISIVERSKRWAQRNPMIAALLGTVALTLLTGFSISTYFATNFWNSRQRYVSDQIAEFPRFDHETFAARVTTLGEPPFRDTSRNLLLDEWRKSEPGRYRDRLAAAMLRLARSAPGARPTDDILNTAKEHLTNAMLGTEEPEEFRFLCRERIGDTTVPTPKRLHATDDATVLADKLWSVAQEGEPSAKRIRALVALSQLQPDDERWTAEAIERLADGLLSFEAKRINAWSSLSAGVSEKLLPLIKRIKQSDSAQRRVRAERAYLALATSPVEKVRRLIRASSPGLVREILFDLQSRQLSSGELQAMHDVLDRPSSDNSPLQIANHSLAKLILGDPTEATSLPIFAIDAPEEARRFFELNAAHVGLTPQTMLEWLQQLSRSSNSEALRTALLAIGNLDVDSISEDVRNRLANQTKTLCQQHPDASVHAACLHVLRHWNRRPLGKPWVRATKPLEKPTSDADNNGREKSWRYNRLGHLLIRIPQGDGKMVEVSAYEITVADYAAYVRDRAAFYEAHDSGRLADLRQPLLNHFANHSVDGTPNVVRIEDEIPQDHLELPITNLSPLQATAYCAWVSERTGVGQDQTCFEVATKRDDETVLMAIERQIQSGTISAPLLDVARDQNGYRLPFYDEWQLLESSIPTQIQLRNDEGWFEGNSEGRIHVVGLKRPTTQGLFDVTGNVCEWFLQREIANPGDENRREIITAGAAGGRYDAELSVKIMPLTNKMDVYIGKNMIGYRLYRVLD